MAAPGVSLANPSAEDQNGLSAMLARIKERAAGRRQGLNVDPQELTPLSSMDTSDSLQAANFDGGESPMVAAIGSSRGGSPVRFASMGEGDEGEVTQVSDCEDGSCGPSMGMAGLPPGARIINERVVSQGVPSGMPAGMPMAGEMMAAPVPQYYPSQIKEIDGEYFNIKDPTAQDTVRYLMQRAAALEEASNAPGVPASTRANMAGSANAARERAMDMFQDAQVVGASDRKIAEAVEVRKSQSPEARMASMRSIIRGEDNSINVPGKYPPEVRVQMIVDANNKARADAGGDKGIGMSPEEQAAERNTLMEMAVAADISFSVARSLGAGAKPFDRGRQTAPLRLVLQYYGPLTPAAREQTLDLDLRPAIEEQLIQMKKSQSRNQTGQEYEPNAQELYEFSQEALAQVDSVRSILAGYDQQRGQQGARGSLYVQPDKLQSASAPTSQPLPRSLQSTGQAAPALQPKPHPYMRSGTAAPGT
jgi:hypothetical protein